MATDNSFEILGLSEGATALEVEEAFRRLSKPVHPDKEGAKKNNSLLCQQQKTRPSIQL